MAIRAEMGRLPLPGVSRWRPSRVAIEIGSIAHPLFSRDRRRGAQTQGRHIRNRWRDRCAGGRHVLVRRPAATKDAATDLGLSEIGIIVAMSSPFEARRFAARTSG